jgi:hypothetical protein
MKPRKRVGLWIATLFAVTLLGVSLTRGQSQTAAPTITVYQDPG